MLNPCCCVSPRIGTFILAILNLIEAAAYGLGLLKAIFDNQARYEIIGEIILCTCLVILALILLFGAIQNSQEKVRFWLLLWLIFIIVAVVFQVFNVYIQHHVGPRTGSSFGAFLLFLYQLWVVYAYLTELRYGPAGLTYCPAQIV